MTVLQKNESNSKRRVQKAMAGRADPNPLLIPSCPKCSDDVRLLQMPDRASLE